MAHQVHDATLCLATPGHRIDSSATDLAHRLREAGSAVSEVPLVGQVAAVGSLAHWLGLAVALIPILALLWFYVPPRIRFVRRATAGQRFLDATSDLELRSVGLRPPPGLVGAAPAEDGQTPRPSA